MTRILLIEDNLDLAFGLRNNLEIEGYEVETAEDGKAGLEAFARVNPDLLILDLMLPELDGFRVLRSLRQQGHSTPVLLLTAKGEEADKVRGLRMGADDYVTKPFGLLELLARVEALLRRTSAGAASATYSPFATPSATFNANQSANQNATLNPAQNAALNAALKHQVIQRFGLIEIDPAARTVSRESQLIELAPKEFDLLMALLRAEGAVVSRLQLMREVWGYSAAVVSRTVDTHVAELRRKLEENPASPRHIITVRKTGYRIKL